MDIKGIIFDMDGLMLDTERLLCKFWCQAANEMGFKMTKQHVLGIRSCAASIAEPKLKELIGDSFDYPVVRARRIELMNSHIKEFGISMKKGLIELLNYLKSNNYLIAVATATDLTRTTMYLKQLNIFNYFDKIVCGSMVSKSKPAPDIYLKACQDLSLEPKNCLALEDSPNGIISAHDAGCHVIMIPDLSEPDDELLMLLDARLDSLDLVIDFLNKKNNNFNSLMQYKPHNKN